MAELKENIKNIECEHDFILVVHNHISGFHMYKCIKCGEYKVWRPINSLPRVTA